MTSNELAKWRERNRCSQGVLSIVLGVDIMTVSRWERDIQKVPSFLGLALKYVEGNGNMIRDVIDKRELERRSASNQRQVERRMAAKAVSEDSRTAERRDAKRRQLERRTIG